MKRILAMCVAAALFLPGCVSVDNSLGQGLVDKSLLFDTHTVEFPLEEITMKMSEDLSGFSSSRIVLGAIRDQVFGLTTRESAFSLIPALDTLDLGDNPKALRFDLYFEADSISTAREEDARILQSIYVTELAAPLSTDSLRTTRTIAHGTELLTDGLPVYNGSGALQIRLKTDFAQKYVDKLKELGPVLKDRQNENGVDRYQDYLNALPGVYLQTDTPNGEGGRINLFKLSSLSVSNNYYYRNNNLAYLQVHSRWNGVEKDSTFLLVPGEAEFADEVSAINDNTGFSQYAFNRTTHETQDGMDASRHVLVEGGGGLKPVIPARELQRKTQEAILKAGGDPEKAIIVKASIVLPFELPDPVETLDDYPSVLSPTIRYTYKDTENNKSYVSFAGLTDASVSSENQGDIDRSNLKYAPDITYHLQELLTRTDLDTATDADIWLLIIHTEKVANASGSLYDSEYYQQLLYASYYNSLYGGGYGYGGYGYGGYGGYGYGGYGSNYYSYMMLAQMMSASSQQSYSYNSELDKDRYYRAELCGTGSETAPFFRVTFATPKE